MKIRPIQSASGTIACLLLGPIVGAMHFATVYLSQSLICEHGFAVNAVAGVDWAEAIVVGATGIALAILAAIVHFSWPTIRRLGSDRGIHEDREFQQYLMVVLVLLSAVGVTYVGATILFLPTCTALR